MLKLFLSHNPEDLGVYFKKAHAALEELGEVVLNPMERDLSTAEVIEHARGCQVIVCHLPFAAEPFAWSRTASDRTELTRGSCSYSIA